MIRRIWIGGALVLILTALNFANVRPATDDEREVLRVAFRHILENRSPASCVARWTVPRQAVAGYGFSSGGAHRELIWLDRALQAGQPRSVQLLTGSAKGVDARLPFMWFSDVFTCSDRKTLGTPQIGNGVAFVGVFDEDGFASRALALQRFGSSWRVIEEQIGSRAPVT